MNYIVFILAVTLVFIVAPYLLQGIPGTASAHGFTLNAAGAVGAAFAAMAMGSLGLLYKPNRFGGFVMATSVFAAIIITGGRAEAGLNTAGETTRTDLTEDYLPPSCEEVADIVRGSLEMREMGFSEDYAAGVASGIYSNRDPKEVVDRVHGAFNAAPKPTTEGRIKHARTVGILCLVDEENGLR